MSPDLFFSLMLPTKQQISECDSYLHVHVFVSVEMSHVYGIIAYFACQLESVGLTQELSTSTHDDDEERKLLITSHHKRLFFFAPLASLSLSVTGEKEGGGSRN
jgi:hypothetical protein